MSSDTKHGPGDVQQRIHHLAYLMWESAGRQQNMALQYWLNAEREVISSIQAAADVMMSSRMQPQNLASTPAKSANSAAPPAPEDHAEGAPAQDQKTTARTSAKPSARRTARRKKTSE